MLVIDVEASGIDNRVHGILSVGVVDLSEPERKFYGECRLWPEARVMDEALEVNGFTYDDIKDERKQSEKELLEHFKKWFLNAKIHTLAGQNAHFDLYFLMAGCRRNKIDIPFSHRVIDLHSIAYFHMSNSGIEPPIRKGRSDINSDMAMRYVGIPEEPKPHNALNGAIWEAEALHRLFYDRALFDDFKDHPVPWMK